MVWSLGPQSRLGLFSAGVCSVWGGRSGVEKKFSGVPAPVFGLVYKKGFPSCIVNLLQSSLAQYHIIILGTFRAATIYYSVNHSVLNFDYTYTYSVA